jgi:hypothetical protein
MAEVEVGMLREALSAAVKVGEQHASASIKYATRIRDLREAMGVAVSLLKRGLPDKARDTLEKELKRG